MYKENHRRQESRGAEEVGRSRGEAEGVRRKRWHADGEQKRSGYETDVGGAAKCLGNDQKYQTGMIQISVINKS